MFAPPVAKTQAETSTTSTGSTAHQRPAPATYRLGHDPVERRLMLQRAIGNQGMLRLLASQPGASLLGSRNIPSYPPERMGGSALAPPVLAPPSGVIQRKLAVGSTDDPLEHEADRIADHVMRMPVPGVAATPTPPRISRKCAECEEEQEKLQRKEARTANANASEAPASAHEALRSRGQPLDAQTRAFFEPRFGRDFSSVRVHTHGRAAAAAADIQARAYTWRNDIAFAAGEFSPGSLEGRRLIAHELAHVAQQAPYVARQAAPPFRTRTFRDDQAGDPLDYTETVQVAPAQTTAGIEGSVDRTVFAPAAGTQPRQMTHHGQVNHIRLTPDCRIVVPYRIQFQQQQAATAVGICQSPPNATPVNPLPLAQFQAIQSRYIGAMNVGLNNRYAARVTGCRSAQPCTDKPLPVEIAAEAVTNNPDTTINVVNRGGRADAGTICAGSFDDLLPIHEGGHQALGAPDEYQETDPAVIAAANAVGLAWGRHERVRSDLSAMNDQDAYGRFLLFHERHFRFAQVFLEAILQGQGCNVSLEPISSSPSEFRLDVGLGSASTNRGSLLYGSLFVGAGIPLERRRRLLFLFGAEGQAFSSLDYRDQNAFTAGLRLGIEAQTTPAKPGVRADIFASGGGLYAPASTPASYSGLTPVGGAAFAIWGSRWRPQLADRLVIEPATPHRRRSGGRP